MSLFYFHLVSHEQFIRDDRGKEFNDLIEAYSHVRSLIHKAIMYDLDWRGWSIKIADANDESKLSVLFPQGAHYYSEKCAGLPDRGPSGVRTQDFAKDDQSVF